MPTCPAETSSCAPAGNRRKLREVPISRRSLEQRFRKALGRTPAAEIRRAQIEVAKQMLAETDEGMARVALAAGFSNAKQLGGIFHEQAGMTPTAYRRQAKSASHDGDLTRTGEAEAD